MLVEGCVIVEFLRNFSSRTSTNKQFSPLDMRHAVSDPIHTERKTVLCDKL